MGEGGRPSSSTMGERQGRGAFPPSLGISLPTHCPPGARAVLGISQLARHFPYAHNQLGYVVELTAA